MLLAGAAHFGRHLAARSRIRAAPWCGAARLRENESCAVGLEPVQRRGQRRPNTIGSIYGRAPHSRHAVLGRAHSGGQGAVGPLGSCATRVLHGSRREALSVALGGATRTGAITPGAVGAHVGHGDGCAAEQTSHLRYRFAARYELGVERCTGGAVRSGWISLSAAARQRLALAAAESELAVAVRGGRVIPADMD